MPDLNRRYGQPTGATENALHPRETLFKTGLLAAANAEIVLPVDGCSSFSVDLRDTFNLTWAVEGTIDGTNWTIVPVRPWAQAGLAYALAIAGSTQGIWVGKCAPFRAIRIRCSAFTSGSAIATIAAHSGALDDSLQGMVTTSYGTATAATGIAATLTLAAPGAGLRQYLTYLRVVRSATALLIASATPVVVTTTNLPGSLAFTFGADAAAQGTDKDVQEAFTFPLAASALNTAVTVVCPATTGVIWRASAGFYVAP